MLKEFREFAVRGNVVDMAVPEAVDTIRVLVPAGKSPADKTLTRGTQITGQSALVIGLLDNHKHNTGKILDRLEERLRGHYGNVRVVRTKKSEAGKGAPREVIENLAAECQAVVTGVGD